LTDDIRPSAAPPGRGDRDASYRASGVHVEAEDEALKRLVRRLAPTYRFAEPSARVALEIGFFATVMDVAGGIRLVLSCDGVGTKLLVAEAMRRFDTVGIDLVAMNVNDVLCVGARPFAMLDYVAVERIRGDVLEAFASGLARGAEHAGIAIPGGEIAQVGEMIRGLRPGEAFECAGFAIGLLPPGREPIVGRGIRPGDRVLGLRSSGLHSNGYTLARRVLLADAGLALDARLPELSRTLGEELLEPTRIYVRSVLALLESGVDVRGLAHVTGEGLLNLTRLAAPATYVLDGLPEPLPVFRAIRRLGRITDAEAYVVFNMGIGFCVVVPPGEVDRAGAILRRAGEDPVLLGRVEEGPEKPVVVLPTLGLRGHGNRLEPT
jgi:phosphoribosylformylglycinamidine cyclo-ligase